MNNPEMSPQNTSEVPQEQPNKSKKIEVTDELLAKYHIGTEEKSATNGAGASAGITKKHSGLGKQVRAAALSGMVATGSQAGVANMETNDDAVEPENTELVMEATETEKLELYTQADTKEAAGTQQEVLPSVESVELAWQFNSILHEANSIDLEDAEYAAKNKNLQEKGEKLMETVVSQDDADEMLLSVMEQVPDNINVLHFLTPAMMKNLDREKLAQMSKDALLQNPHSIERELPYVTELGIHFDQEDKQEMFDVFFQDKSTKTIFDIWKNSDEHESGATFRDMVGEYNLIGYLREAVEKTGVDEKLLHAGILSTPLHTKSFPIQKEDFDTSIAWADEQVKESLERGEPGKREIYSLISIERDSFDAIFYSSEFQETLRDFISQEGVMERTHVNAMSLAIAAWRYAEKDEGGTVAPEEIRRATQFILEAQENTKNEEIMGPNTALIVMSHEDEEFDNELVEEIYKNFGGTRIIESVRGLDINPVTGENREKTKYLTAIGNINEQTTIVIDAHGNKKESAFAEGYADEKEGKEESLGERAARTVHASELAVRLARSPLGKAGQLNKIRLMPLQCNAYRYAEDVSKELDAFGYKGPKPFVLDAENADQLGFMRTATTAATKSDPYSYFMRSMITAANRRAEGSGDKRLLLQDFYRAESVDNSNAPHWTSRWDAIYTSQDPALIIPYEKPVPKEQSKNKTTSDKAEQKKEWIHIEIGGNTDGSDMAGIV